MPGPERQPLRQELLRAWQRLDPRARRALPGAAAFCIALLAWTLVVLPAHAFLDGSRRAHRHALALLARVAALPAADATPAAPADANAPGLVALVNGTAPGQGLVFGDYRPTGDARLALELKDGDFDALLRWLDSLHADHGVDVETLDVRPTQTPGRVDVSLALCRPCAEQGT